MVFWGDECNNVIRFKTVRIKEQNGDRFGKYGRNLAYQWLSPELYESGYLIGRSVQQTIGQIVEQFVGHRVKKLMGEVVGEIKGTWFS